jgi:tetratricopeptide (TPR) repeat protein
VRGAAGAHLHSFSAGVLRSKDKTWTGPLVAHGITGTCGTVYEPLSVGFPYGTIFMDRFLKGYTFGESMQMANMYTSWMAVFVGDPLYAPYAKGMKDRQTANRKLAKEGAAALEAALDKGDLDAAEKLAKGLAELPGDDFSFLIRETRARRMKPAKGTVAELRKALSDPKKALALSECNFEANLAMGRQLLEKGSARAALENLQRAVAVDLASGEAQLALGLCFKELKQWDDAVKALEASGLPASSRELGAIYYQQKKYAEAAKRLAEAGARDHAAALMLARCHVALKEPAKAVEVLEAAVNEPPAGPEGVDDYGACWEELLRANQTAKNKEKTDICAPIVAGLAARKKAATARPKTVDEAIDGALKQKVVDLPALPVYDDKFTGLPTVYVANRSDWDVSVYVSGPIAWSGTFRGIRGTTKPKTAEIPAWPGKYRVVVVAKKGAEIQVFFREATLDLNKNYSIGVERDLKLYRADKP